MAGGNQIDLGNVYNYDELVAYRKAAEEAGLELIVLEPGSEYPLGGNVPLGAKGLIFNECSPDQMVNFWATRNSLNRFPIEKEKGNKIVYEMTNDICTPGHLKNTHTSRER